MKIKNTIFIGILLFLLVGCSNMDNIGSKNTITGNVVIEVEESTGPADFYVCSNSENYDQCSRLVSIREFYKEECCSLYNLCC